MMEMTQSRAAEFVLCTSDQMTLDGFLWGFGEQFQHIHFQKVVDL
jgi:hypothetical protein